MKNTLALIICGALMLSIAGCSTTAESAVISDSEAQTVAETETDAAIPDNSDDKFVSAYPAFTVTSESLDGTRRIRQERRPVYGGKTSGIHGRS